MKNFLTILLVAGLCTGYSSSSFGAPVPVGLVDVQRILVTVEEGKAVRKKLEDFFNNKQDLLKKDEEKFKTLQQNYEKQKTVLKESARGEKEKELRELYMSIQNKTMGYQEELQDLERELKKPLIDKIKSLIEVVSQKAKVAITFEMGPSAIMYAEEKKDLTEDVIQSYNKIYSEKK